MTTTYLAALIRSFVLVRWWENRGNSKRKEGVSEERHLETEGERDDSRTLPAWRRHISGLSLGGRQRRLTVAEHGPLENSQEKSICVKMSEKLH